MLYSYWFGGHECAFTLANASYFIGLNMILPDAALVFQLRVSDGCGKPFGSASIRVKSYCVKLS